MAIRINPNAAMTGFRSYDDASDVQLLALQALGDERALEVLMQRYRGLVWRVTKTYLGSATEAEDIIQDISVMIHTRRDIFTEGSAKFSSWLYRVVTNRCLDILKSSKSPSRHSELDEAMSDEQDSAEETLLRDQLRSRVQSLLAEIPEQQRRALTLFYYDENDVDHIAQKMGVSVAAVRSLLKRGKESLRQSSGSAELRFS